VAHGICHCFKLYTRQTAVYVSLFILCCVSTFHGNTDLSCTTVEATFSTMCRLM
jgi:hypothetical protein